MRWIVIILLLGFIQLSCSDEPTSSELKKFELVKSLELPELEAGMSLDSTLESIRIFAMKDSLGNVDSISVEQKFSNDSLRTTVNIFADKDILAGNVDSIIDVLCPKKNIRLVGLIRGEHATIPFHCLKRFPARADSAGLLESLFHAVVLDTGSMSIQDKLVSKSALEEHFKLFYGDAFAPHDSTRFPKRLPQLQNIGRFENEAMVWDKANIKSGPDSAVMLSAYNTFVNKLEIFQKVGPFYTMNLAVIDVNPSENCSWGSLINVFSVHYLIQKSLKESAIKYLAEKQANEGQGGAAYEFSEEDLLLLYPDRLRWNGRMSGTTENLNDPFHLSAYIISETDPLAPRQVISFPNN